MHPAVADRLRREVRALVVARHRDRPPADDLTHLARRQVGSVGAHDPHLVQGRRHADRARLPREVVAVEDRDKPLGEPVELVETVRQPPLELVFVLEVERRSDRADHLERPAALFAEVVTLEQRHDLGGNEHDVRRALTLDRLDHPIGVEPTQQDVRAAEVEGRQQRQERPVEDERAGVDDDALRVHPVARREARAVGLAYRVCVDDPLRQPRRSRRVDDVERIVAVDRDPGGRLVACRSGKLRVRAVPGPVAVDEDEAIRGHAAELAAHAVDLGRHGGVRDERARVRVVHEVRQPAAAEEGRERHDHVARPRRRVVELDRLDAVLEHGCDLVALLESEREQRVRDPVDPSVELRERDALALEDDRRVARPVARVARQKRVERHQAAAPFGDRTRRTRSATQTGFTCPSRSTVAVRTTRSPFACSATELTEKRARMRLPAGTGEGKRTRSTP